MAGMEAATMVSSGSLESASTLAPAAAVSTVPSTSYTCFACRVGFGSAEQQRLHYKSDWHRYNLKRKVVGMPALTAEGFRERVAAQRAEADKEVAAANDAHKCALCDKRFASKNALASHLNSKKHKDKAASAAAREARRAERREVAREAAAGLPADDIIGGATSDSESDAEDLAADSETTAGVVDASVSGSSSQSQSVPSAVSGGSTSSTSFPAERRQPIQEQRERYAELNRLAAQELDRDEAAAKAAGTTSAAVAAAQAADSAPLTVLAPSALDNPVLALEDSLFDLYRGVDLEDNLRHMSTVHGFFVPHLEYVADLPGLMRYLQVKIGNYFTCVTCNKPFGTLEGVRGHMADKGHKMIDYSEEGQDELGPYYDFSSTYPDDESLDEAARDVVLADGALRTHALAVQDMELVLPSGARLGHRDLKRYYCQSFKVPDMRESVAIQRVMTQ